LKRIGIFGGTFNPVHMAHLITAEDVCSQMSLDKVLFIPAANHPLKDSSGITDFSHRMKMVELAIKDNEKFEASDIEQEISGNGKSFTVNTLMKLREYYKDESVKLYLVIGMDNLIDLDKWKDPGKLFMLSEVVVFNKPNYFIQDVKNEFGRQVTFVPVKNIDITATDIRQRIKEGKPIKYLVTPEVEKFIIENKLYK
jgi:nicotinate-nucleotide adenylyltransferase